MEVVIVGGGIVGATIAYELSQKDNIKVVLVHNADDIGVTKPSFAWVNAWSLVPRFYHDFRRKACDYWRTFVSEIGGAEQVNYREGCLKWADNEESATYLKQAVEELASAGHNIAQVSIEEARRLEPALHIRNVEYAAYAADEATVDAGTVARRCLQLAEERGVTLIRDRVSGLHFDETKALCHIRLENHELTANTVVLAAGSGSAELAEQVGVQIPLVYSPGLLARAYAPASQSASLGTGMLQYYSSMPEKGVVSYHLKQERDGRLVFGEGDALHVNDDLSGSFQERTKSQWESMSLPVRQMQLQMDPVWCRPLPIDGLPMVGRASNAPWLYVSVMHSAITLSPLMSKHIADDICSGESPMEIEQFNCNRFEISL
mmetsp:Transcript_38/g.108  ORF Transcript_38/g.108 Transcript_38/m.108 type:complete len:376 (-) Transcript_38:1717-2844(-)